MAQALKKQVPGLTAAHLAAFTNVAEAPELHLPGLGAIDYGASVVYPDWWRHPEIVMRGWQPRLIEPPQRLIERVASAAAAVVGQIRIWRERARSRSALLRLDDRMLRDLGVDRVTARYLGTRPFWRADD